MKRRRFVSVVGLGTSALFVKGLAARDVLQEFHARYGKLKSISCSFTSSNANGSIKAEKGGRYRIDVAGRTIISDSKTVWNVQKSTKTVVVNNYNSNGEDISIERIFFVILNVYRSSLGKRQENQEAEGKRQEGGAEVIVFKPADKSAMIANVSQVDVHVNSKMDITAIDVYEDAGKHSWKISKLKLNGKNKASEFTYQAPTGWNVVDVR